MITKSLLGRLYQSHVNLTVIQIGSNRISYIKFLIFFISRMSSPDAEVRLYDSPTDSISSLNFNSDGSRLLCSAWDSKLRLYNVDKESF